MLNAFNDELLNEECGAAYVQLDQKLPRDWDPKKHANKKCVSIDGDADRQIYFYANENSEMTIIDGDKQFAFIIEYIRSLMDKCGVLDKVSHIMIQTAYRNQRTEEYLKEKGIDNQLAKTGV